MIHRAAGPARLVLCLLVTAAAPLVPAQGPLTPPGPPNPNDVTVYLNLSDQGTCYWKQGSSSAAELISISEIGPRLADYKNREGNNARILIQGDMRARFGPAVQALDEIRKVGIEQVSVQTTVQPTGK